MLFILYNIIHITVVAIFWPILLALVLLKPKYRRRIPERLGYGLATRLPRSTQKTNVFWIHALSVGEVTSAVPLVVSLRNEFPDSRIVVTVATETGEIVARSLLAGCADQIISSPVDLLPVINRFLNRLKPDILILVETDFWPNTLLLLQHKAIPAILVNGRISQKSLGDYRKLSFFFRPMFNSFRHLCMQTSKDVENMHSLGIDGSKLHNLGNLKIDNLQNSKTNQSQEIQALLPQNRIIFTAGSTHPGEEELILQIYQELLLENPEIFLVLAPRNPQRATEILQIGSSLNLRGTLRTEQNTHAEHFLLVDTIGELVEFYRYSDIAFVGGSLVPEGGHNPIEPASMAVPVLFGHHMQDFSEIAADLITAKGAISICNKAELKTSLLKLIADPTLVKGMGANAQKCIEGRRGGIEAHIRLIRSVL